jgi:O-acetyl-ADP-ribose deacetylase (regulator of RNase III)
MIELIKGDITKVKVDVIVNAANKNLLGGGGVDGAIHHAAGKELLEECKTLFGCNTGDAKITKGYKLPSRYVIHTVGPVWYNGNYNEEGLLASCYKRSMEVAEEFLLTSIAFPNISTGLYCFPKQKAAEIALAEVKKFKTKQIKKILFVTFDEENYKIYKSLLI